MRTAKKTDTKLWYAGYGSDPYVYVAQKGDEDKFLGGVFMVESEAELEKAALLPGAGKIEILDDAPGGGKMLTLNDPEGFPVNLICGQEPVLMGPENHREKLVPNTADDKSRVAQFLRFKEGPAAVHKVRQFVSPTSDTLLTFKSAWTFRSLCSKLPSTVQVVLEQLQPGALRLAIYRYSRRNQIRRGSLCTH
jgi:hypothetical protein